MNLNATLLASFWVASFLSYFDFLGLTDQPSSAQVQDVVTIPIDEDVFLNEVPPAFEHLSVSFIKDNFAVIPGEWDAGDISEYSLNNPKESVLTWVQKPFL